MQLAELNVGRLLAPPGDPLVAEFIDNIDRINALAKRMPGFVWMLEGGETGNIGAAATDEEPLFNANLSVWEDATSLRNFVYKTAHARFLDRKLEWFAPMRENHLVFWWVPAGHRPSLEDALARLELHRKRGDSDRAFGWDWLQNQP